MDATSAQTSPNISNPLPIHDKLSSLPDGVLQSIFEYLDAADLSRVALCSRTLRNVANQDSLWRPLCRRKKLERFGTVIDITKERPYLPPSPHNIDSSGSNGSTDVTFKMDAIVTHDNRMGLSATCRWKEIFVKATHLENNWKQNRHHVSSLNLQDPSPDTNVGSLRGTDCDGDYLVVGFSNDTVQVWDVKTGTCQHVINVNICNTQFGPVRLNCSNLKVKNGIIVVSCKDGMIRSFNAMTGELMHAMKGPFKNSKWVMCFHGDILISASIPVYISHPDAVDNSIHVHTVVDGVCRHVLNDPPERGPSTTVEGERSGRAILGDLDCRDNLVAAAYHDKRLRLWDTVSGACVHTFRAEPTVTTDLFACALFGDNAVTFADFERMVITIWSTESLECMSSVSIIGDFEYLTENEYRFPGACESLDKLLLISLDGETTYYANVYTQKGDLLRKVHFTDTRIPQYTHGNKTAVQGPYQDPDVDDGNEGECFIHKAKENSPELEFVCRINPSQESDSCFCFLLGIDETKISFSACRDDGQKWIYIQHYW